MEQLNIDIRPMQPGDAHHLVDIDLKSNEIPYTTNDWQTIGKYFQNWRISVLTLDHTPIGFALIEYVEDEKIAYIHKFAVKIAGKKIGADELFLNSIEFSVYKLGAKLIQFTTPVTSCFGKMDPYDISEWLVTMGYKCVRIEENKFERYGNIVEAYIFQKEIL